HQSPQAVLKFQSAEPLARLRAPHTWTQTCPLRASLVRHQKRSPARQEFPALDFHTSRWDKSFARWPERAKEDFQQIPQFQIQIRTRKSNSRATTARIQRWRSTESQTRSSSPAPNTLANFAWSQPSNRRQTFPARNAPKS